MQIREIDYDYIDLVMAEGTVEITDGIILMPVKFEEVEGILSFWYPPERLFTELDVVQLHEAVSEDLSHRREEMEEEGGEKE